MRRDNVRNRGDECREFIYNGGAGTGKNRANQQLELNRMPKGRNYILTNMERPLASEKMQGGEVNRIIDVEMSDGYIFENGNLAAETLRKNYGFAGKQFIKAIEVLGIDRIKEMQQANLKLIKDRLAKMEVEKEEKQTLPMSILLTADQIATDYIFGDGIYLDLDTCIATLKSKEEIGRAHV